jgi:hypothetical protein
MEWWKDGKAPRQNCSARSELEVANYEKSERMTNNKWQMTNIGSALKPATEAGLFVICHLSFCHPEYLTLLAKSL